MRGEIVDMLLFDLGGEVPLEQVGSLLGATPAAAPLLSRLPAPPSLALPAPLRVEVPAESFGAAPPGTRVEVRLHALGVLALRVRVPLEVGDLRELPARAAALRIAEGSPRQLMRRLADIVTRQVGPILKATYEAVVEPEPYTVYALRGPVDLEAEARLVAGIVLGEPRWDRLAPSMVQDALRRRLQYAVDDAVIVGWDNAVVVSGPGDHEDLLDVMELANLELLELRTLDAILDRRLEASLDRLERLWQTTGLFRSARALLADLAELRADFARIRDSVQDTGKIFGDWYLAKLHQRLRDRFHLHEWENAVEQKMDGLEDMFQMASEETNHRRALILEMMIVLLFVLDIIVIFSLEL